MYKSVKFWDRIANNYDRIESKDEEINNMIVKKTISRLKKSDYVLDYGCGTGTAAIQIADSVAVVGGIDISSKMIEKAKSKRVEKNIENIEFTQTTIFDEKLIPQSFDVIISFYLLHLVDDVPTVIKRLHSLLKPGGLFISATPCMGEKTLQNILLTLAGKAGFIPEISSFKINDFESIISNSNFEILEIEHLHKSSPQYFIVAKKV